MNKTFTACLLVQEGSNTSELKLTDRSLIHSKASSEFDGKTILLAGGFPSVAPEQEFPISTTLQLAQDLSGFSSESLQSLARAELLRIQSAKFKSYIIEEEKRVCVIGRNAAQLNIFIDTYSGIVEVEPLVTKELCTEFDLAEELRIDDENGVCSISYAVRSPVDQEVCTYCGECANVCPENCILKDLSIDYSRCTFCKECEKSCSAKAVDVHGVVYKTITAPAVIVLEGAAVALPEKKKNIYSEQQLSEYFARLAPVQIEEVVTSDNNVCQYNGNYGKGCGLCFAACSYGAVAKTDTGIEVDAFKCQECGECTAACPTGAMQNLRFSDQSFIEYLNQIPTPVSGTVVITQEQNLHEIWWNHRDSNWHDILFIPYQPVSGMSMFHLIYLYTRGLKNIIIYDPATGIKNSPTTKEIDLVNQLITGLCSVEPPIRRACSMNELLAQVADIDHPVPSLINQIIPKETTGNRRNFVAYALGELIKTGTGEMQIYPEEHTPFASLSCDTARCTQCLACLNVCQIGAITADQDNFSINHLPVMCVGCGLCSAICPENALVLTPQFVLNRQFFKTKGLAAAEPMHCKSCNKVFGTKASYEKVMKILENKEDVDTSHFAFCEACRVIQLFDTEQP